MMMSGHSGGGANAHDPTARHKEVGGPGADQQRASSNEAVRAEVRALLSEGVGQPGGRGTMDVNERLQFLAQAEQMLRHHVRQDPALVEQALASLPPLRTDPSPPLRRVLPALVDALLPPLLALPSRPRPYALLAELVGAVAALMEDETPTVARRALQCAAFILSDLLRTLVELPPPQVAAGQLVWAGILRVKQTATKLITTAHPAISIQLAKLLETYVLCFLSTESKWGFSLGDIPPHHPVLAPSALNQQGKDCLETLMTLAQRVSSERTAGGRMAAINCLALILSQNPQLANEIIPHLSKIDPSLSTLAPGSLAVARQTLRLALQYISKLPACTRNGLVGSVNTAIGSIGSQVDKEHENERVSSKRKADESSATDEMNRLGDIHAGDQQPSAKRQATELVSPPSSTGGIPGRGAPPAEAPRSDGTAPSFPPTQGPFTGGLAPLPYVHPAGGLAGQPTMPPAPIQPLSSGDRPPSSGGAENNELGVPASVLSLFVLDHVFNLPSTRELVRNEPLPPMDLENLLKLLGALTAARSQTAPTAPAPAPTPVPGGGPRSGPPTAEAPTAPLRDPRTKKEAPATVPPLPGFSKVDSVGVTEPEKAKPATVKVAPPVLPLPVMIPTIGAITLSENDLQRQLTMALMRIVRAEAKVATAGAGGLRRALVARLATMHSLESDAIQQLIQNIAQNLSTRYELALEWLYQEATRAAAQGKEDTTEESNESSKGKQDSSMDLEHKDTKSAPEGEDKKTENATGGDSSEEEEAQWGKGKYGELLRQIMEAICAQELSTTQETVYCRLLASVPLLTPTAFNMIEQYVVSGRRINLGLTLLKDMVTDRPSVRSRCLNALLSYTLHDDENVRAPAVRLVAYKLFSLESLIPRIERFARETLLSLIDAQPAGQEKEKEKESTEEEQKEKRGEATKEQDKEIALYFALCTKKPSLLDDLLEAYTRAGVVVKKSIHKQVPQLMRAIGIGHPYIRQMVQTFPKGAETFVLQALHLLTDQSAPTPELTEAVKGAYEQRTHDARFLIPVLAGLSKDVTIANLPKLISLPPTIVKNVIHRLLHNKPTPISPEELLVALHVADQDKKEKVPLRKLVEAIQYCMEQKEYTQGILAIVLQQLIEVSPLPTLFMRTTIQTVTKYPKLTGFVMGLLGRLITKQVWTDERLWQGWIKCCRTTTPHSYPCMLQLPPRQLEDVLQKHPDLKKPLAQYHQANPSLLIPRTSSLLLDPQQQ